jgi:DNA-binding response OmpR family regulator
MDDQWDDLAVRREDRRLRALVADDDEGIRTLLTAVLELDGWEVRVAGDGAEAVALTEAYHPDAVLLDVMMPNVDGLGALRRIRADHRNHDVTVVMVSAFDSPNKRDEAKDAGADDFIVKPVAIDDVVDRVAQLVRRQRGRGDEQAAALPAMPTPSSPSAG